LEQVSEVREHGWEELFEEVKAFCLLHNIIVPNMEDTLTVRGRARGRGGQLVTHYHHFKYEIFNVVHDQIIVEMNNCFAKRSTQLLRCITCLDPRNSFANYDRSKILELAQIYKDDFSSYDLLCLRDQIDIFIGEVRNDSTFALVVTDLEILLLRWFKLTDTHSFSVSLSRHYVNLDFASCDATVVRSFSVMKSINTELLNKMGVIG